MNPELDKSALGLSDEVSTYYIGWVINNPVRCRLQRAEIVTSDRDLH